MRELLHAAGNGGDGKADGPGSRSAEYTARILWDWKEAGAVSRLGHARVRVRFTRREAVGDPEAAKAREER